MFQNDNDLINFGKVKLRLHTSICVAMALRGAWAEHEQKESVVRGMLHTPIYLAMTIATQIGVCKRSLT